MILVNALQAAGALVDLFAGFSLAAIYDPINNSNVAIFGRFYELIAVTLLFTTERVPAPRERLVPVVQGRARGRARRSPTSSNVLTKNLGQFLVAAIEVAGPVLGCLFLAEVTLGLLSRAAPSLNVFALAFPLRVIVALDRRRARDAADLARRSATSCATRWRRSASADVSGARHGGRRQQRQDRETNPKTADGRRARRARSPRRPTSRRGSAMLATTVLLQMTFQRGAIVMPDVLHEMGLVIAHPDEARRDQFAANAMWKTRRRSSRRCSSG